MLETDGQRVLQKIDFVCLVTWVEKIEIFFFA